MARNNLILFAGNSHPELSRRIAHELRVDLGDASVGRFSDGEVRVEIRDNVRGSDVFLLQSTSAPTNDNVMELIVMADAIRRASATRITAVVPYFGYARQDRRPRSERVPISAKVVADMLAVAGVNRVLTVDLHSEQIQGFFNMPVDNVFASPLMVDHALAQHYPSPMVVSPDVGGAGRARAIAKMINDTEFAIIDKRRPRPNESEVLNVIGDVEGRTAILVDDIVDTAGSLCQAAQALKNRGASKVVAYVTHAVLSGNAVERIESSQFDRLYVTDTIPLSSAAKQCDKIQPLSLDRILAEAIRRVSNEESISAMFR